MNLADLLAVWDGLCSWAWQTSLSASVLIGVVFAFQATLAKRLPVRARYFLSLLVLARLVMPVIPAVGWSPWGFNPAAWRREATVPDGAAPILAEWNGLTEAPFPRVHIEHTEDLSGRGSAQIWRTIMQCAWTLGVIVALGSVGCQHRRLTKWIRKQEAFMEPSILVLLERAKELVGVKQHIGLVATSAFSVPTLCGWRRPTILLPAHTLDRLDERELKLVFLHELAHIKRRDILLNWLMIFVRSLHWFNPFVWGALRRLRADRELVCDELVLHLVSPPERIFYGKTLLKLLDDASSGAFCPSLVPILNKKHEIKRRIMMISKFKPASRLAAPATATLIVLTCWFTFTRAADPLKPQPGPNPTPVRQLPDSVASPIDAPPGSAIKPGDRSLDFKGFRKRLTELQARIARQQEKVHALRVGFGGMDDGRIDATLDPETIRAMERERISADAAAARYQALYKELKSKNPSQLAQAIPTAIPDVELMQLLRDLNGAEIQFSKLSQEFGPEHSDVRQFATVRTTVNRQIEARIDGILAGLQAQVAAQLASAAVLSNQVHTAKTNDAELAEKYRPYFLAKRDLEVLQKLHEAVLLKAWTTEFGVEEGDLP